MAKDANEAEAIAEVAEALADDDTSTVTEQEEIPMGTQETETPESKNAIEALLTAEEDQDAVLDQDEEAVQAPEVKAEIEEKVPAAPEPTPEPEPKPESEPVVAKTAEPSPVVEEPTPVPDEPIQPTPEEAAKQYADWRQKAETALETHYAPSDELVELFETDPGKAIAKMSGRVYLDAVQATTGHIVKHMPNIIQAMMQAQELSNKNEGSFFDTWPQLKEHRDSVVRLGIAYRQTYPTATQEEFIRDVGAQTMVALKMPGTAPAVVAPTPAKPFKPAATTPVRGGPTAPANPFDQLAADFEEEDASDFE